jgi:hypothetical protein
MPERIQLKRSKGWQMPPDTVKVTRPGPWGNQFIVSPKARPGARSGCEYICVPTVEDAVSCYRLWLEEQLAAHECVRNAVAELRGKNLACWCQIGAPCHADVLLEICNK